VSYAISEDRRELALSSGEAYFDVVRDGRPFQVRTPAGVVDVIGTAFNLDVVDTRTTQVAVYHGRVAVDSGAARLQIAQGEQVDLTAGAPLVRRALEGDGPDWRDGWFEARDESLIRVLQETSRFSPLPIEVGDPALASIHLSGRLRVAEPERVLAMLERAHGLRIRREPARIVLLPADAERQP
jgi:transmembrane sensor